jgi:ribosomal protein S18 acetylase RimI-like enzyme
MQRRSDVNPLDNPVWYALHGQQERLSTGNELARRYQRGLPPLAAMRDTTSVDAWNALGELLQPGELVGLLAVHESTAPRGWDISWRSTMAQMICTPDTYVRPAASQHTAYIRDLGESDGAAMMELAGFTQLRPLTERAVLLGRYIGAFDHNERLIAMAGERLRLYGMTEISAVCTHPLYRRRGLALMLTARLTENVLSRNEAAFLHIMDHKVLLHDLYRQLGFSTRSELAVVAAKKADPGSTLRA